MLITQSGKIKPLHVERARLQTFPQCRRGDTPTRLIPAWIAHTVAVLKGERIQDVLRRLVVALSKKRG